MAQYVKGMDGQYPGSKLLDPQGSPQKYMYPYNMRAMSAANTEVAVLLPSAGMKVRGMCLKGSAEKAEIGKRAAEHGVLTPVCYYATKLPIELHVL